MEHTSLAAIIPTLNAELYLGELVAALRKQTYPVAEIIVIDSGSQDATSTMAEELGVCLLTIEPQSFDHGATRNLAAAKTGAEILLYLTQDALPVDQHTADNLVQALFQNDRVAVAYARQMAKPEASPSEKFLRMANYPLVSALRSAEQIASLGIRAFQSSNACAAYKRKLFFELGAFPEPSVCNEDMLFAARALLSGYSVAYCAEAQVWHTHGYNCRTLFRRYFDIAASLDYQPRIKELGQTESSGWQFFKGQINYLQQEKQLKHLPMVICETAAKYLGYKCGAKHLAIPRRLKQRLGLNRNYWSKYH